MTRLSRKVWIFLLPAVLVAVSPGHFAGPVRAESEEKPTISVTTDFLSQYIFRGYALSSDGVVIQPAFVAGYKGFSINVWGNLDTNEAESIPNSTHSASWNETDLTLSYTRTLIGDLSGKVGYIYYGTIHTPDTMEGFAGLSYALPWLTVSVSGYREFYNLPAWWVELILSRNFKLPWYGMNVDTALSLGYLDKLFEDFADLETGQISAALNIPIGKYLVVSPKIGFAFPLSDAASTDIKVNSVDHQDTHVFGGLCILANF
jgi:hypothetical protein